MDKPIKYLDDVVSAVLSGGVSGLRIRLGEHFINCYWVRGKGKEGRDVLRVDITPYVYRKKAKEESK
jgi:hypothetical protein